MQKPDNKAIGLDVNFVSFAGTANDDVVDPHERMQHFATIATSANPIGSTLPDAVVFLTTSVFETLQRFPTFEESRESNYLVSGTGLQQTDRVLYVSHRWYDSPSSDAARNTKHSQTDTVASAVHQQPDNELNITFNLIRVFLSEAEVPYTHIWIDCCCTDINRMEGIDGDAQMLSSLLALYRSSSILMVSKVITTASNNDDVDKCFSDLRDMTSRGWIRLEMSLAIHAKIEVIIVCLHNKDVAYVTLPTSGAIDKYVKSVAVKFNCWSTVRRYWDRLWQPIELLTAAEKVLGKYNTTHDSELLYNTYNTQHQTTTVTKTAEASNDNESITPDWLLRKLLSMNTLNLEDFVASGNAALSNKLPLSIGVCTRDDTIDKRMIITLLLRGVMFTNNRLCHSDNSLQHIIKTVIDKGTYQYNNRTNPHHHTDYDSLLDIDMDTSIISNSIIIDLRRYGLSPYDIIRIPDMINTAISLHKGIGDNKYFSLLLDCNGTTGNAASILLDKIDKINIHHISFAVSSISNSGCIKISTCLQSIISDSIIGKLTSLDVSWCNIGSTGIKALSSLCNGTNGIKLLRLDGNAITNHSTDRYGIRSLCKTIKSGSCSLHYLSLNSCGIDVIDTITISSALTLNTSIRHVNMSDNNINHEGASSISKMLKKNTTLIYLDLSFCLLGHDIAQDGWVHKHYNDEKQLNKSSHDNNSTTHTHTHTNTKSTSSLNITNNTSKLRKGIRSASIDNHSITSISLSKGGNISCRSLYNAFTTNKHGNATINDTSVLSYNKTLNILDLTGSSLKQDDILILTEAADKCMQRHSDKAIQLIILSEWKDIDKSDKDCDKKAAKQMLTYLHDKLIKYSHKPVITSIKDHDKDGHQPSSDRDNDSDSNDDSDDDNNIDDDIDVNDLINNFIAEKEVETKASNKEKPFTIKDIDYHSIPNSCIPLEHIGTSLIIIGNVVLAQLHLLEALLIRENLLGPCSPYTASYLLKLSTIQANEFHQIRACEATLKRCLLASEDFFNTVITTIRANNSNNVRMLRGNISSHVPITLAIHSTALSSLGLLLMDQNRLMEAKNYLGKALECDRLLYGRDHCEVAGDLTNLAILFSLIEGKSGPLTDKFLKRSLEVFEISRKQGRCNATTLANAIDNMANSARQRNDYEAAASYYRRSLGLRNSTVGPYAISSLYTMISLADTLVQDADVAFEIELQRMISKQIDAALKLRWHVEIKNTHSDINNHDNNSNSAIHDTHSSTHSNHSDVCHNDHNGSIVSDLNDVNDSNKLIIPHGKTDEDIANDKQQVQQALMEDPIRREEEYDELSKQLITHPMIGIKLQEAKDIYLNALVIIEQQQAVNDDHITDTDKHELLDVLEKLSSVRFKLWEITDGIKTQRRVTDVIKALHGAKSYEYNKAMLQVTIGLFHDGQVNASQQVLDKYILPELYAALKQQRIAGNDISDMEQTVYKAERILSRASHAKLVLAQKLRAQTASYAQGVTNDLETYQRKGSFTVVGGKLIPNKRHSVL